MHTRLFDIRANRLFFCETILFVVTTCLVSLSLCIVSTKHNALICFKELVVLAHGTTKVLDLHFVPVVDKYLKIQTNVKLRP